MSVPEFLFALRLSGREPFYNVLVDVATNVFRHVGCAAVVVTRLVNELNAVVAPKLSAASDVHVQFRGQSGSCEVIVLAGAREIWRTTYRDP